jgi:hypothetical protein
VIREENFRALDLVNGKSRGKKMVEAGWYSGELFDTSELLAWQRAGKSAPQTKGRWWKYTDSL